MRGGHRAALANCIAARPGYLHDVMAIHIGCGSWADAEYAGLLYPRGFPSSLRLSAYAMWFDHVEVNASYYRTPPRDMVQRWAEATPPNFQFDLRLHRMFSISPQKTTAAGRLLPYLLECVAPLIAAKKLGVFLLVLSPNFAPQRHSLDELDELVAKLRPHPLAIELRHAGWVADDTKEKTLAWFRARKVTWVAVDMPRIPGSDLMPPVDEVTHPRLAYLRLHGRNPRWTQSKSAAEKHAYFYNEAEIDDIVLRIRALAARARDVRVLANNHAQDFAPRTALILQQKLGLG
jgi:uncharacterized protein YecE (DUF72 family)